MHSFQAWSRRLRSATTAAAVLEVMASFLGSISPTELDRLPREVRAELDRDREDIPALALELVREDLRFHGDDAAAEVLHEVALALAEASGRLAEIDSEASIAHVAYRGTP